MTTDLYKQDVNYNDGEGLVHGDFNDAQRFAAAKVFDGLLEKMLGSLLDASAETKDPQFGSQNGANAPTQYAYCINGGQANLIQGSTNAKIGIAAGTLLQKVANASGNDATLLSYTFDGTDEVTIADGAVNNRVDLIQMKLEIITTDSQSRDFENASTRVVTTTTMNKKRRVQCTLSVKQGATGATPTVPEPDAGYVPIATVLVPTAYAHAAGFSFGIDAASPTAVVHDQRMPLSIKAYTVDAPAMGTETNWTLGATRDKVDCTNATNTLYVPCPAGGQTGRLIGVEIGSSTGYSAGTIQLIQATGGRLGGSNAVRNTLIATPVSTALCINVNFKSFESLHTPSAGVQVVQSATTKIGAPIWTNGHHCAREKVRLDTTPNNNHDRLGIKLNNVQNAADINHVTFYIAEGL